MGSGSGKCTSHPYFYPLPYLGSAFQNPLPKMGSGK